MNRRHRSTLWSMFWLSCACAPLLMHPGPRVGTAGALSASQAPALGAGGRAESPRDEGDAPEVRQAEPPVTDAEVQRRLTQVFSQVQGLKEVEVQVRSGVVTLRGVTTSDEVLSRAVEFAEQAEGVVFVTSEVRVTRPVPDELKPTLGRLKQRVKDVSNSLPLLLLALGVFILFVLIGRALAGLDILYRFVKGPLLKDMARRVVTTLVVVVGAVVALELLELTWLLGAVFGAAGVLGVVLGFALREILENYLASILLGIQRPFSGKDHVVIGGHEGKVIMLTSRDTILMTLDGNHVRLPNSAVFKAEILNYSRNPMRRFDFIVGLGVGEDISQAVEIGCSALAATDGVSNAEVPFARVQELGESNVALRFFGWVDQRVADWNKVRSESIRRVKVALDSAGLDMPVPTYQVQLLRSGDVEGASSDTGPRPRAGQRTASRVEADRPAHTVQVDSYLDDQIERDQEAGADANLLER